MLSLKPETLAALRDKLLDRAAPPTLARPNADGRDPEAAHLVAEYGPLVELMFLVMSADGEVAQPERDVLRGALRELDPRVRSAHFGAMLLAAEEAVRDHGPSTRLLDVGRELRDDPVRAEVAFVLAAAIAFADDRITTDETSLLNDLADALGIDEAKSEELMRALV